MFAKKSPQRKFYTRLTRDGVDYRTSSSGDKKVSSDDILSSIQWLFQRDGKVVIEFIDNEEIHITSLNSVQDDTVELKLDEIKEMIKKSL